VLSKDSLFAITIKSNGKALPEYSHLEKTYVLGPHATHFQVALENMSLRRALAVISINGHYTVYDQPSKTIGVGYILLPRIKAVVECWRKTIQSGDPFQFGVMPSFLESSNNKPQNSGLIEATFFYEQDRPYFDSNWPLQSGFATHREMGNGWGHETSEKLVQEQFARENPAAAHLTLYYTEREVLESLGYHDLPVT
jgi:hypothetical protein